MKKFVSALALIAALSACGSGLKGTVVSRSADTPKCSTGLSLKIQPVNTTAVKDQRAICVDRATYDRYPEGSRYDG